MKNYADAIASDMLKIASSKEMKELFHKRANDEFGYPESSPSSETTDLSPAKDEELEVEEDAEEKLSDMTDEKKCKMALLWLAQASEAMELLDQAELSEAILDLADEAKAACKKKV